MADLKTTNIYGDAYINNKVGIATNAPATRLQIGQLTPSTATEGIQFGDDVGTRIYRSGTNAITISGSISTVGNITSNASVISTYGNFTTPGIILGDAQYGFYVVSGNVYYKSASGGVHYWRNKANNANTLTIDDSGNLTATGTITAPSATVSGYITFPNDTTAAGLINTAGTAWFRLDDASSNMHMGNSQAGAGIYCDSNAFYWRTANASTTLMSLSGNGDLGAARYLTGTYVNTSDDVSTGNISHIVAKFGDNYHRSATAAKVAAFISGQTMNIGGNAATVTTNANLSGDVTSVGNTTTIANTVVTNAKLKEMGASTIKGNNSGTATTPSDLTPAQVATMLSGQTMNIAGSSTSCTGNAATATTATALTSMNISQFTNNSGYLTSAVTSLAGTTNRITVSGATGAVTLNLPQDIHTGASPTFAGLSLTSVSTTGATITNLTGAYQNTTVYDSPRTQSATPSRGIRAPASSIQFTDSYAIAPFYTYRSTGDWPVPYGIGWGTGGESSGIFQRYASNGSSFGDMIFYTGNDGSGAFSFRRHTWEGTTYFAAGSGELNTELFRIDWSGNLTMLGTLNGSANSATLYANNGSYGSWKIGGTRNGWYGIEFESGTNLMANSNEVGFHRNGHGWQLRWSNGVGYVYKGAPGGGTEATILDSSNQSYAWNMNQNVRSTDSPTFGTLQLTRLNFGAQAAAPYAAASGEGFGNGITFGGDENSAAYRIFTGMENIGGNYSKLTLNWHTGIRIGAYYGYGGIRFYDNYVGAGTKVFSIAESDSNVRVYNELFVQGGGIGSYGFLKYGGTRSGDWQLFTTSSGQINVVQVENFGAGGHTNYPTGVYTYGGVMSWRLPNHSFQLYAAHTGDLAYKTQWNNDNYSGWRRILDSSTYPYAANMNQYVRTTDTCSFAGLTVSNTINGSVTGNAATATTLQTARNINGTSFNGSAAITTATWGTARTLTIGSTGKSVDGSAAVSWSLAEIGAAATNQTMFIGTTSVAINRASAAIALAGTSIDGTAAGLNSSNYISRVGSSGNYNTDFQNTPAGTVRHLGDDATATNNPGGTWWFVDNYRHSNNSNYWGTQVAWGWEDNANKLATRNVLNGTFGSWVYYLNSVNYTNYTVTKTGTGASGNWDINAATVTNGVYTNTNNTLTGINVINNTSNTVINNQSGNLGLTMFQATAGTDAYMTFHIGSDYAAYLGLGGAENDLVYGGWSAGNNRHRILHSGNASFAWNMNQNVRTTDTCSFASVSAALFTGALNGTASELISGNTYTVGSLNVNTMAQLVGVKETYVAVAPASNVVTINLNAGTVFRMTYNSVISSFTLSNVTAGKVNAFTLISIASAGAGGITFTFTGYTLKWAGGTAPTATTTAGKFDVFSFIFDGTNWYGFTGGLNY